MFQRTDSIFFTNINADNLRMTQKELMVILKRIILYLILFFLLFIIMVNIFKLVRFIHKIDKVIKQTEKNDGEIFAIDSQFNELSINNDQSFDLDKAHYAEEIGYKDALFTLNGSEWGEGINILLVGSDKAFYIDDKARSDVIIILRINTLGQILSLSIPRDTLIKIKDGKWAGADDKIGHSLYWEGMDYLKKNVEELIGSPIYKVAIIDNLRNFEAFLAIIGGLDIDKHLEGKLGIQWIRNRNFKEGDVERCRRQQFFLKKAVEKIWRITKKGNYIYVNFLYDAIKMLIRTDITRNDFLAIIYSLRKNKFDPENNFLTAVLPGEMGRYDSLLINRNDLYCWIPDNKAVERLRFLFYSEDDTYKYMVEKKINFWSFIKIDLKF